MPTSKSKIISISDLHLGQTGADKLGQYSLLSARAPLHLLEEFCAAVTAYAGGDSITLVVAGDFLDLSLSYVEDALLDLESLLATLARHAVKVDEIVYLIGNHDHHLWSLHSEDKRLLSSLRAGRVPSTPRDTPTAKAMYQVTSADGEPFPLLQPLVDRIYGAGVTKITIAYPSYTRQILGGPLLYFTHGHLLGGLYTELSSLLEAKLTDLQHDRIAATVNQPIIELIYWLIGETGEGLGADGLVEEIYTDLQRGTIGKIQPLIKHLVAQQLPNGILWGLFTRWERAIAVKIITAALRKALLSPAASTNASADRHADLVQTRASLLAWLKVGSPMKDRLLSGQLTHVIYGHTHVRDRYQFPDTGVVAWNLNTWLVEPDHPFPETGFLGIDHNGSAQWVSVSAANMSDRVKIS